MLSALKERINSQLSEELPFVVYRKPNSEEVIGILQKTNELHKLTDFSTTGFVFAPFDTRFDSILFPVEEKVVARDFKRKSISSTTEFDPDSLQRDFHVALVKQGIAEIKKGSFRKVVLSRRLQVEVNTSPFEVFQELLAAYTSAFCYLWYHPKVGMWLGATPEILLRTENRQFTTMSLAGTRSAQIPDSTQWGLKELEEQALVTEYIKNVLHAKVKNLNVAERETLVAGNLMHLRTKITGRMIADLKEIIGVLHPTPAVCGMPMAPTKDFILEHENYDREFYTGFLGELNFKREIKRASNQKNQENQVYRAVKTCSELYVNLRCMQLVEEKAFLYVGGGITAASNSEKEWQETVNKSGTMLRVIR